jgi:hypothetical protein
MQPKIASPLLANFLVRCEELGLTGDQTLAAVKRAAAFDPEIAAEFKKEAWLNFAVQGLMALPALWRAGKGLFGAGATAAKTATKAVPPAMPVRPPVRPPVSTLLARPKAPPMPKLAAAFLDRCDELGLTEAETLVAVKRAMAADPAAAAAFEKVGWAGLVGRAMGGVTGWLGKQFSRLGKAPKPAPGLSPKPTPGLPPPPPKVPPSGTGTTLPSGTGTTPPPVSGTTATTGKRFKVPAENMQAMRQSGPSAAADVPNWFNRNSTAIGVGSMGAMIGIPMVTQNKAEGAMRAEVAENNDRSGQLALAAQTGDSNMLSAFAQQHKLQPHAAAALTRLAAVPEFRAQLTNQQTAGHLMHQLRLFAAMPGMTEDNLTGMLANQLEPGVGMKTVTAAAAAGPPGGMSRLLANLKTKLMGSPEAPNLVRQLRDTGGGAISSIKQLLRDEWRGGSKNPPSTVPTVANKPRGPALSTRVSDLLGIPGGKIRGLGLSAKKHIYDTSMTDVSPFLRHPATQVTGLVGAGAASPFAYDYLSGSKTPEEVTFKAGQAASPEVTERALSAAPIPMPGVVAPPPPRVAVPDTAGPSFMSRLGTGASDVWGGLSKTHKGLLLGGGGLLANHLLKETTGYGADLGTPGLLAGLGTAGYGLSGGSFGGLLDNIKKIIGMQGDDAPPAGDAAADVAAATRGSPELATFRTRINQRPSATAPAGPAAAGGLTLQQAAIDPRFSKYFKGGQPDTRALAGANDADLVTAITALDKPSRATLRQQVDAYQPSMMEQTFGNADHHKRRFQGLLAKVGSRLVKAGQRSNSDVSDKQLADSHRLRLRAALLAGLGASAAGDMLLSRKLLRQFDGLAPTPRGGYLARLKSEAGLPDIPFIKVPLMDNAAYAGPSQMHPDEFGGGKKGERDAAAAKTQGSIVYDPTFDKPGIMAHELGHASIYNGGGLSGFNQSWLRPAGDLLNQLSPVLGAGAGYFSKSPAIGAAAGLAAGLLTGAPTLLNEWQATSRGKKYLERAGGLDADEAEKNRDSLRTAFLTYLAGATVPATVGGGVGGLLAKKSGYSKSEDWSPTTRRLNPDRSSNIIAAIGTPDHPDSFYWTARKANNDAEYQADIAKHFRGPVLMRLGADDPTPDVGTPTPDAAGPSFLARNLPYLAGGGLLAGIGGYGAYRLLRSRRKKDEDEDEEKSASRSPINDLPLVSLPDLSPSGPLMPVEPNSVYAAVGPPRPTSVWSSLSDPHKAVLAGGGALTAATLLERVYRRLRRKHEDPDDEGPTLGAGAALLGAGAAAYGLGSGRMPRLGENAAHLLADGKAGLRAGKGHVGELLGGLRDRIGV